eukprot:15131319-Heterocapsa_arctica.AAC.1
MIFQREQDNTTETQDQQHSEPVQSTQEPLDMERQETKFGKRKAKLRTDEFSPQRNNKLTKVSPVIGPGGP